MELRQLRCFVAAAEQLHFGRAAQHLQMLPSAFGRHIKLLEEDLGTRLFARTTRAVSLTDDGALLLREARIILSKVSTVEAVLRGRSRSVGARNLKVGAIDSAAAGLMPQLLRDFRAKYPDVTVHLLEEKTFRLLPKVLSGALDLVFIRPPEKMDRRLECKTLLMETAVVALPRRHALARNECLSLSAIAHQPMIVPDRRSRPHSHDLTMKLFEDAGLTPRIAQLADEKQTIVNMVAAGLGLAVVPRWTSRMAVAGVRFVPLKLERFGAVGRLPLAASWLRGSRDPIRDTLLTVLEKRLRSYAKGA
ncbi:MULTISPECIES: LysR family transcriptional regulator [Bradyrhizobium]|uniref:LysR family transcriptional regulator n=3 Tax=Bradyrhizobium TaxID=374 RepID=A0A410VJP7_9BRAD|nr:MULTISPECIES: LysR family transcriptional regulator [Bradyrhizobium]MCG2628176.1 LysR family transcriptional regulator [Bradyrhizobium zhengyangense]MCG2643295.1 LysR family transcriptional regulator [Bradyrhizobium zhengyangense]MCG2670391.1 LysR family transcriptional regulator [Bradyrhizobium zhengyangense]MDN4985874.1 LysR family transcriptional regulator [Bradyrhizobium sp. WYCCWR 13022]MDN5002747.1 LysR family transcriptional regulator [Bradyrhizobium sp. WYCCWR 12677]